MKISVVVPVYKEGKNPERFLWKLISVLEGNSETQDYELIIVDTNNKDRTSSIINKMAKDNSSVKLIHKRDSPGFGNALKFGFKEANGDVIIPVIIDNISNSIENIPQLVMKIEEGYDIAYGSRFGKGGCLQEYPRSKLIANKAFNNLIRFAFGISNKDVTNTFKAYKRNVLEAIGIDNMEANGFDINVEIPLKAHILGFKSIEVPVCGGDQEWGGSNLNLSRSGYLYGMRLLKLFFWGNLVSLKDLFGSVMKGSLLGTLMAFLLGIVILTFIFSFSGFSGVFKILESVSLTWFILCCSSILMSFLLRTWRWDVILRSAGYEYHRGILFKCIMFGWFLNYLIPARVGDLARGVALQTTEDAPLGLTLSTIVIERIFDMITLVLFLTASSLFFFKMQFLYLEILSLGITLMLLIGLGVLYKYDDRISKLLAGRSSKIGGSLVLLKQGLQAIVSNRSALILCFSISLPIWFFEIFCIVLAARGLGVQLPLVQAAISGVTSFVAQTVPLTPAGLGVHEASITSILGIFGVTAQMALSISLIDHFARGSVIYVLGFISAIHIGFASRWHSRKILEENRNM